MEVLNITIVLLAIGCLAVVSIPQKRVDYTNAVNITGPGGMALTSLGIMDGKEFFVDLALGNVTFGEALDHCHRFNMSLASIMTLNQEDWVWYNVPSGHHMWLAGSDLFNEGTWVWMKSQEQFIFIRWAYGQPLLSSSRNCLILNETLNDWWTVECGTAQHNVLCEREVPEFILQ